LVIAVHSIGHEMTTKGADKASMKRALDFFVTSDSRILSSVLIIVLLLLSSTPHAFGDDKIAVYRLQSADVMVNGGAEGTASVECNRGDAVTGGGYQVDNQGLVITMDFATAAGWTVTAFNPSRTPPPGLSFSAWAICATGLTTYDKIDASPPVVNPGEIATSTVSCTGDDVATGGGYTVALPRAGSMEILASKATGTNPPPGWTVAAFNSGPLKNAFAAVVVCMTPKVVGGVLTKTYAVLSNPVTAPFAKDGSAYQICNDNDAATGGGFPLKQKGLQIEINKPTVSGFPFGRNPPNQWQVEAFNPTGADAVFGAQVICLPSAVIAFAVPEFGSPAMVIALAAVAFFGLSLLRQRRMTTATTPK
jgi:hypothetical protein